MKLNSCTKISSNWVVFLQQFITVATQTSNNNRYVEAKNLPTNLQNTLSYYYNKYNQLQNLNLWKTKYLLNFESTGLSYNQYAQKYSSNRLQRIKKYYFSNLKDFLWLKQRVLKKSKLAKNNFLTNFTTLKKTLHILTKHKINIYFINSLSFTKFYQWQASYKDIDDMNYKKQKKYLEKQIKYLNKLEFKLIRRWRRVQFMTKDLINVIYISLFFKNTEFLSKFISYQLTLLPKNKRQTSFIKMLSKILFNFKGSYKEIVGLRLSFKGRFNRWSRSKVWKASAGILLFQSYNSILSYSCQKGLVRKGVFSTRVWIQYKKEFQTQLKRLTVQYFKYSKIQHSVKHKLNNIFFKLNTTK